MSSADTRESLRNSVPPDGAAWAAVLAAGIGCAVFGLLVILAEASKAFSAHFIFYKPAGDLSGKSTIAVLIWLIAWVLLAAKWKQQTIGKPIAVLLISVLLVLFGFVAVFPPFFELFAPR